MGTNYLNCQPLVPLTIGALVCHSQGYRQKESVVLKGLAWLPCIKLCINEDELQNSATTTAVTMCYLELIFSDFPEIPGLLSILKKSIVLR